MKKIWKIFTALCMVITVAFTGACNKDNNTDNDNDTQETICGDMTLEDLNNMLNDSENMNMDFANAVAVIPFDHINGPRDEWDFYAIINFQYPETRYVKYQVTYLSCTCRADNVNYWQTAYMEMSTNVSNPENSKLRALSFDIDGTGKYTAGFWGDSDPIKSGDSIIATYDDYVEATEELTKFSLNGRTYTIKYSDNLPSLIVSGDTEIEVSNNTASINGTTYTLNVEDNKVTSLTDGTNTIETTIKHSGVYVEGKEGVTDGWYYPTIENEFINDLLVGKTKAQLDQYSVMDDMLTKQVMSQELFDAFTGASVSTNNILRIVQAVFKYHAETWFTAK